MIGVVKHYISKVIEKHDLYIAKVRLLDTFNS